MTSLEELATEVRKDTRGVLLSKIGGVPLEKFERDYQALMGKRFPYRDLGFSDLRSCLESMDDTVRFEFTNDKWMLFGIADSHSFMSSPAIKAQFTPDKPIKQRRNRQRRNFMKKKSSDSDDSTVQKNNNKRSHAVNGESTEFVPNMKGLYGLCVPHLPHEKDQEVTELFSEVASHEEQSRSSVHLFLRYKSVKEAQDIIDRYDGYQLGDFKLTVNPAREKIVKGRTNTKHQSSIQKESDSTLTQSLDVKTRPHVLPQPKEEVLHLNKAATGGNSRQVNKNRTDKQNGRTQRVKRPLANGNETKPFSQRQHGRGDDESCSQQGDSVPQLPWKKSQKVNGDVLGSGDHTLKEEPENDVHAKSHVAESVSTSAPTNAFSNRTISKPSLPSILDIADRLKSAKM